MDSLRFKLTDFDAKCQRFNFPSITEKMKYKKDCEHDGKKLLTSIYFDIHLENEFYAANNRF